ncbi:MAG TPA: hypothetical protein VM241_01375 [Candidatus Thermoplasmatota archaeon]|nr:hypothetical protein [Candidatus Thermoplasmatota archaeon]
MPSSLIGHCGHGGPPHNHSGRRRFLLGGALVLGGVILVNRARQAVAAIAPDPVPTVAKP